MDAGRAETRHRKEVDQIQHGEKEAGSTFRIVEGGTQAHLRGTSTAHEVQGEERKVQVK